MTALFGAIFSKIPVDSFVAWLADYYLASTVLLLLVWGVWRWVRQPVHRIAVAWTVAVELLLLTVACATPFWPRVALWRTPVEKPIEAIVAQNYPALELEPLRPMPRRSVAEYSPREESFEVKEAMGVEQGRKVTQPTPSAMPWTGTERIAAGFLVCLLVVLLRQAWGAWSATRILFSATPADEFLCAELNRFVGDDGIRPRLMVSRRIGNAVAIGLFRPTIILPSSLAETVSLGESATLRAVLAHEMAHLKHRDLWLLTLGRLLSLVLFAQPLFWWLRRAIRVDQELRADAAAAGENRHDYAEELLRLVRITGGPSNKSLAEAVGIWEESSPFTRRIVALLDETFHVRTTGSRRWILKALVALTILGSVCSVLTLQPAKTAAEQKKEDRQTTETAAGGNSSKGLAVRINAKDAKTGATINTLDVTWDGREKMTDTPPTWQSQYSKHYSKSDSIEYSIEQAWPITRLRIDAEGYLPSLSRPILREEGKVTLDVAMEPSAGIVGKVLLPDGTPAADASIAVCTYTNEVKVEGEKISYRSHGEKFRQLVKSAVDGSFKVPAEVDSWMLVVAHPQGYAEVTAKEYSPEKPVRLQPWGRIEGRYVWDGKPRVGEVISIRSSHANNEVQLDCHQEAITDAEGRFVMEQVPPGKIALWPVMKKEGTGWAFAPTMTRLTVAAGETTRIKMPSEGQGLVGRVRLPAGTALSAADYSMEASVFPKPPSVSGDQESVQKLWDGYSEFMKSEFAANFRRDKINIGKDGEFRVEGLPAGEYVVQIRAESKRSLSGADRGETHGFASRRVTVQAAVDSSGLCDCGEMILRFDEAEGEKTVPDAKKDNEGKLILREKKESDDNPLPARNVSASPSEASELPPLMLSLYGEIEMAKEEVKPREEASAAGMPGIGPEAKVVTDLNTIAEKLAKMRDVAREQEASYKNIRVKGRYSAFEESFVATIKNGKYRFDLDITPPNQERTTTYWLDDGNASFAFSIDLLHIDRQPFEKRDRFLTKPSYLPIYCFPELTGDYLYVSDFCDLVSKYARDGKTFEKNSPIKIQLNETGTKTAVEIRMPSKDIPGVDELRRVYTFDAGRKYVLTDYWNWTASIRKELVFLADTKIHADYREIAPGVYFLSQGISTMGKLGKEVDEIRSNTGKVISRSTREFKPAMMLVDSVEIGDFPVDEGYFDVHRWPPIRQGIRVDDNRADPHLMYVWDKGDFDTQVLQQQLPRNNTTEEQNQRIARAFANPVDLEKKQEDARGVNQNVLIVFGDPKEERCRDFYRLYLSDGKAQWAMADFRFVAVDTTKESLKEMVADLKKRYELDSLSPEKPTIVITDTNGKKLAAAVADRLSQSGKIDRDLVIDFLKNNEPTRSDAQKILDDAYARAASENKVVFLEETGAYCKWCTVLARWLESQHTVLNQDFVVVKIDRDRFEHGDEIMKKIRLGEDRSIPWVAILDQQGKKLGTSDGPKENIGFPSEPEEVDFFLKMLSTSARRINPQQWNALRDDLIAYGKKIKEADAAAQQINATKEIAPKESTLKETIQKETAQKETAQKENVGAGEKALETDSVQSQVVSREDADNLKQKIDPQTAAKETSVKKQSESSPVMISGQVVDDETGTPIEDYAIIKGQAEKNDPQIIYWPSDAEGFNRYHSQGNYEIPIAWHKNSRVRILANGYLPQMILDKAPPANVERLDNYIVRMKRGGTISGRVVYYDGKPAVGVAVFLVGNRSVSIHDGKAWTGSGKSVVEDKSVTRTMTDLEGRFKLTGKGGDAKTIVVSGAGMDIWAVADESEAKGEAVTIQLPEPGKMRIRYDIPDSEEKLKFSVRYVSRDDRPDWQEVYYGKEPWIDNKGDAFFDNLPPGEYLVARLKSKQYETHGWTENCDRTLITVESGKTANCDFVRDRGTNVEGRVVGLKEGMFSRSGQPGAVILVFDSTIKTVYKFGRPVHDIIECGLDGKFKTERLAPGEYEIVATAESQPNDIESSFSTINSGESYFGRVVVTVKEEGPAPQVTIPIKPREETKTTAEEKKESSPVTFTGQVVDDETGKPIEGFVIQGGRIDDKVNGKITWGYHESRTTSKNPTGAFQEKIDWQSGWRARVLAAGYVPEPLLLKTPPSAGSNRIDNYIVRMKRGKTITGQVRFPDGSPAAYVSVFLVGTRQVQIEGGKAINRSDMDPAEDNAVTKTRTDAVGKFSATGWSDDVQAIAVSGTGIAHWSVPASEVQGDFISITLPNPGKLVVKYDIPGGGEKVKLLIQKEQSEMPVSQRTVAPREPWVKNQGEIVLDDLSPGKYSVLRQKAQFCDRTFFTIESGKTATVEFVRPRGTPVEGKVVGLTDDMVDNRGKHGAIVFIAPSSIESDSWTAIRKYGVQLQIFDAVLCDSQGKFTIERLPPGEYSVIAEAYSFEERERNKFNTSWPTPAYFGCVVVTVKEDGPAPQVTIPIKPREETKASAVEKTSLPGIQDTTDKKKYVISNRTIQSQGGPSISSSTDKRMEDMIVLYGYSPLMYKAAREKLHITTDQRDKLKALQRNYYAEQGAFQSKMAGAAPDDVASAQADWEKNERRDIAKRAAEILSPEQMALLNDFVLGEAAFKRFGSPQILDQLGLDASQREAISQLRKETEKMNVQTSVDNNQTALAVLNAEQRERFEKEAIGPDLLCLFERYDVVVEGEKEPAHVISLFPYPDFSDPIVWKMLGLSEEQQKQVQKLYEGYADLTEKNAADWKKLSSEEKTELKTWFFDRSGSSGSGLSGNHTPEEIKKWEDDIWENARQGRNRYWTAFYQLPIVRENTRLRKQFEAILTPQQALEYNKQAVKNIIGSALFDRLTQNRIGADESQRIELKRLMSENVEKFREVFLEKGTKMVYVLTPEQRAKFKELLDGPKTE